MCRLAANPQVGVSLARVLFAHGIRAIARCYCALGQKEALSLLMPDVVKVFFSMRESIGISMVRCHEGSCSGVWLESY